jgi:hypothetical protein
MTEKGNSLLITKPSELSLEILIWNIGVCLEFGTCDLAFHQTPFAERVKI